MDIKQSSLVFIVLCALSACTTKPEEMNVPAPPPFDISLSDPAAVELADSIISASGGQKAWDETRFISWNISGERDIVWDKQNGKVRIDSKPDQTIYLLNVATGDGKVQENGKEITDEEALKAKVHQGMQLWRADAYTLLLPFKLKESGISLIYLGEDSLADGAKANVVEIQVKNQEQKTQRKYRIFIGQKDNIIRQIADFNPAEPDSIGGRIPLDNYKKYGNLMLSADRSDGKGPREVKVDETVPENVFDQF
jgi:hypothetical protein